MGGRTSKITRPTANVVNEVTVIPEGDKLYLIELCLIILTIVTCMSFGLHIYSMHNKILKKRYLSRANNLDKI